ncbi:MAG: aldehyde dehydrogenase family protein [Spirochaetia bacterium]|nr:aldehyde dehydrogenase family protein [Spirochaetia bacterium]
MKSSKSAHSESAHAAKRASHFENVNPATLAVINRLPNMTADQVESALKKARGAVSAWSGLSVKERAAALDRVRRQLIKEMDEMIAVICEETGKTQMDGLIEVFTTAEHMKSLTAHGPQDIADEKRRVGLFLSKRAYVSFKPRGVVGVISPWNYPLILTMGPVAQALLAGNTVVVKPSEITPNTSLKMREIALRAGLPADAFQVLTGDGGTGAALVSSVQSDMICFTGSTATGRKIGEVCGRMLKPVILELGGKDPMVVFEDADFERAVNGCLWGGYSNMGQTCISVERVFVHESIYERFVSQMKERVQELRQGMSTDNVSLGSMTFPRQLDIVQSQLEAARLAGASIQAGGSVNGKLPGLFFAPTIVTHVKRDMAVQKDESFGPLITITPFKDEDDAVKLANDTEYGLNASVWTKDKSKARRVARRIDSGMVCINDVYANYIISDLPFGGVKTSGLGRVYSKEGIRAFTNQQSVCEDRLGLKKELWWFPYTKERFDLFKKISRFLYG